MFVDYGEYGARRSDVTHIYIDVMAFIACPGSDKVIPPVQSTSISRWVGSHLPDFAFRISQKPS